MKVLKFGGTSLKDKERINNVANIINNNDPKIVVLSAVSGTTDTLEEIVNYFYHQNHESALEIIRQLEDQYKSLSDQLFSREDLLKESKEVITSHFDYIRGFTKDMFTVYEERAVLAQGELLTSILFYYYLQERGFDNACLLPALNFMRIDKDEEPDYFYIRENLERELNNSPKCSIFITQGYICRNVYGEIDNLKRGGSDYSASLIGAAIKGDEIQIWTDIDGVRNNDPRVVDQTYALEKLSFEEAAELSYFGAKILHPSSILPARDANIPVRLKNTYKPDAQGSLITKDEKHEGIKAIAAKDDITAIKIKSSRMLLTYGYLRKVFEVFEVYKTSIDMIATSEVSVSVTIDDTSRLDDIVTDLKKYGTVEVDHDQTIICIIGDFIAESKGYAHKIFQKLSEVPARMISYGGSRHNISVLINTDEKQKALQDLNGLFY